MIIDAHMHICPRMGGEDERLPYQSATYGKARGRDGLVQVLPPCFERSDSPPELALAFMDWAGVERAFLVQGPMYGFHNRFVAGTVSRWPERFLGFAIVEPRQGAVAVAELEDAWGRGLRGCKVEWPATKALAPQTELCGAEEWRVWQKCAQLGMVLSIHPEHGPEPAAGLRRLAEELGVRLVIEHLGGAPHEGWQEQVRLAHLANVYVGVSAVFYGTDEEYPAPRAQECLRWAVEEVGAQKLVWGSDYPSILTRVTYLQSLDLLRRHCDFLSADDRDWVLGRAAAKLAEGLWL